jgi:hypothetical protein
MYREFPLIRTLLANPANRQVLSDILTKLVGEAVQAAMPTTPQAVAAVMAAGYHVTAQPVTTRPLVPRSPGTHHAPNPETVLTSVSADSQRGRLLLEYWDAAGGGLTDEEAATAARIPDRSCWWKRSSELRQAGLIQPMEDAEGSIMTRPGAAGMPRVVCVVTPEGEAMAAGLEP